ncbi:receptor kinase-like protein Xa21 [Senna tora]|uniref:non-specific serine/threonine protein kinase n=1 Tax=Senna tora TaxID=362788 RepID=A0A834XEA8_9FABA|nr:receptor kinase-like protein Xa21 [Senna tora]
MCRQLPLLRALDLSGNQFEGGIPKSIINCTSLNSLQLGGNSFTGFIPMEIGNLDNLETLDLSDNYLKGYIPSNIYDISTLERLYLRDNSLSGLLSQNIGSGQLPKSMFNTSKLLYLGLDGNKFSGVIPNAIGNLTNLIELSLSQNDLNGTIPITINKLQRLQRLDLSNNRLQGSIINEVCQIKSLSELSLASNMFTGFDQECLGNLTSLQKLTLSSNKLISYIPSSLWSLKYIMEVDLSSNKLSGTIPLEISNLRALTMLNLSRNQISGNIPSTIGGLQTLVKLSLAYNKLQGSIPESLGNMISMEFLDLSQNKLSGVIPKSLESLVHLKYMNLSYNLLHGEIPNGGPFKNFTAESFMMNGDLCGKPQLQVHPCQNGNRQRSTKKKFLIKCLVPIMLGVILVVSCIIFLKRKKDISDSTNRDLLNMEKPIRISYYELLQGTNGLDESNLLGKGSFGSVYKGILTSGQIVAVKVFNLDLEEALRSFDTECTAICNLRHRNLIKIISSCSNVDFKSLIMEFMPNGSLDKWLYSHNYCLDFLQRLNIMIDVASALDYLHHGSSTPTIHCDVKPSNVLLDNDMVAHLSDFGIAKLLGEQQLQIHTETFATVGYMAPEYGSKGVVSVKGDVYSYGIMLMEMFTRKKPTDNMFVNGLCLKEWVSKATPHSIINILDANLLQGDNQNIDVVVSMAKIKVMFMQNDERSSYIVLIPGLSETDLIHLRAIPSTSFIPFSATEFPISSINAASKHSEPRPSATRNLTQSVISTPPSSPDITSPAHLPVRSSKSITPKA